MSSLLKFHSFHSPYNFERWLQGDVGLPGPRGPDGAPGRGSPGVKVRGELFPSFLIFLNHICNIIKTHFFFKKIFFVLCRQGDRGERGTRGQPGSVGPVGPVGAKVPRHPRLNDNTHFKKK